MSDIVEQIRKLRRNLANRLAHEAADEIERLRDWQAEALDDIRRLGCDIDSCRCSWGCVRTRLENGR